MIPSPARRALLVALAGSAAACNPLSRPFPDKQIFALEVPRPPPPRPAPRPRILLMRDVVSAPATEARGLVSRLPGSRQQTDFWNEFALPPARLVDDQLRRWLEASGAVRAVLDAGSQAPAGLVLEATLLDLFADLTDPRAPAAQVSLAILLLGTVRTPERVLSQATLSERSPLAATDPQTIVAGMNRALAAVFGRVEATLRTLPG